MVIIETSVFQKLRDKGLDEEEFRLLQNWLSAHPDLGVLIPHGGGLRKIRWPGVNKGKRGGTRIIYYWAIKEEQILLLFFYSKNDQGDLTKDQLKRLRDSLKESDYK